MFGDFSSIKIINKLHQFCTKFKKKQIKNKIIFCIPHTLIHFYSKRLKSRIISLGAQNCDYHESPQPFTGSVAASMIKKAGAKYVILGHSENRIRGESNQVIKKKIQSALKQNLNVIFCIGETLIEKRRKKTFSIIRNQIKLCIEKKFNLKKIIIAYEPIWSIGTGKVPHHKELKKIFHYIKIEYKKIFRTNYSPIVIYGGSVNKNSVKLLSKISEIDGFLIGGASQSSKKFIDIIKNYYK
jgi:triosephosphate isomerase